MTTVTSATDTSRFGAATTRTDTKTLGQKDFLRLMTTQLTSQDPFNPMDNTQMVAQMAQFSQVTGIAEVNANMAKIASALSGNRYTGAASWIGRNMLTESTVAAPLSDGSYGGTIALAKDADSVSLSLVTASGRIVNAQNLGKHAAGELSFAWDGKDRDGNAVTEPVRIVVNALADNQAVETSTASWTQIGGIQSPAAGADSKLVTGLGLISPEDAIRLS